MKPRFTYLPGRVGHYNYNKDEVLHHEGDWYIRRSPQADNYWASYIHHHVNKNILQQNPWVDGKKPDPMTYLKKIGCEWSDLPLYRDQCSKCHNKMPDGIVALWKLHNFEALQEGL